MNKKREKEKKRVCHDQVGEKGKGRKHFE